MEHSDFKKFTALPHSTVATFSKFLVSLPTLEGAVLCTHFNLHTFFVNAGMQDCPASGKRCRCRNRSFYWNTVAQLRIEILRYQTGISDAEMLTAAA
jgi:hypothetical protein